jgi:putative membrane protein
MMGGFDGFGGGMAFGGIGMLLFWGLVIAGVVVLVRWLSSEKSSGPASRSPEKSALDILGERYARGEIGKEEFEQKRRDLGAQ